MEVIVRRSDIPMEIVSVPLDDIDTQFGPIRLLCAQWWMETPHFVLLKYSAYGVVQDDFLRLDIDKRAVIDEGKDWRIQEALENDTGAIWALVVERQQQHLSMR